MTLILLWNRVVNEVTYCVIPHTILGRSVYVLGKVYPDAFQLNNESIAEIVSQYSIVLIHCYEKNLGGSRSHSDEAIFAYDCSLFL